MAIVKQHLKYYRDMFAIQGFLSEPFLMIGFQDILGAGFPPEFDDKTLQGLLQQRGLKDVQAMDYFDERAEIQYDLNTPIPEDLHEKYKTVFDIGSIEHVFDAKQCLENCLRMVSVGGLYGLVTPVHGYYGHGLITFHPSYFVEALKQNNFDIKYLKYSGFSGKEIKEPRDTLNSLIYIVAEKKQSMGEFVIPQQQRWEAYYKNQDYLSKAKNSTLANAIKKVVQVFTRIILQPIWGVLWTIRKKIIKIFNITEC